MFNKDCVREAEDRKRVWVPTPEWAKKDATPEERAKAGVWMALMTADDRDQWEGESVARRDAGDGNTRGVRVGLVVRCAEHEDGTPFFTDADKKWLGAKSSVAVNRLFDAALELNKLSEQDVDELTKNSDASPESNSI